jgi:hypothetical protein
MSKQTFLQSHIKAMVDGLHKNVYRDPRVGHFTDFFSLLNVNIA